MGLQSVRICLPETMYAITVMAVGPTGRRRLRHYLPVTTPPMFHRWPEDSELALSEQTGTALTAPDPSRSRTGHC